MDDPIGERPVPLYQIIAGCEPVALIDHIVVLGIYTTGAWGICDSEGNEIVEPLYDDIGYFQGDYADFKDVVARNQIAGIRTLHLKNGVSLPIKQQSRYDGEVVVKPEWEDLIVYEDCASVCKQGRWGMMLFTGTVVDRCVIIHPVEAEHPLLLEREGKVGGCQRQRRATERL